MRKDSYQTWVDQIKTAYQAKQALNITGANTKAFYGGNPAGKVLDMTGNQGIIEYDPAELVIVARAGTPLAEIQSTLEAKGQMLGFEPPFADAGATVGGAIAVGLSGAGRPYRGGVRDYLLGSKIINGKGEVLQFGGRVMKNVAGFDLFRPMAGAMGTLGVLLEVSLRVVPLPEVESSYQFSVPEQGTAIKAMSDYGKALSSISAAAWLEGEMHVRLSGSQFAVKRDVELLQDKFKLDETDDLMWSSVSAFKHDFFKTTEKDQLVTAINLAAASAPIDLAGTQLIDWGGARRYLKTTADIGFIRDQLSALGASVNCLSGTNRASSFQPLSKGLMALHKRLKLAFDPAQILNPGRLYPDL
jgi:glycolate oxidase FAD binding subunit